MSARIENFVRWGFIGAQVIAAALIIYGDVVHDHRYFVYPYCAVALAYILWERRMRRRADSTQGSSPDFVTTVSCLLHAGDSVWGVIGARRGWGRTGFVVG